MNIGIVRSRVSGKRSTLFTNFPFSQTLHGPMNARVDQQGGNVHTAYVAQKCHYQVTNRSVRGYDSGLVTKRGRESFHANLYSLHLLSAFHHEWR